MRLTYTAKVILEARTKHRAEVNFIMSTDQCILTGKSEGNRVEGDEENTHSIAARLS